MYICITDDLLLCEIVFVCMYVCMYVPLVGIQAYILYVTVLSF